MQEEGVWTETGRPVGRCLREPQGEDRCLGPEGELRELSLPTALGGNEH